MLGLDCFNQPVFSREHHFNPYPPREPIDMQYQILTADSARKLAEMVNTELRHDWVPTGGLVAYDEPLIQQRFMVERHHTFFCQAMIKSAPQPVPNTL